MEIPKGYCQCGCGQKTEIVKESSKRSGYIKGQPRRFINHHNGKGEHNPAWNGGRRLRHHCMEVWTPDRGYVREHILMAEEILEKHLPVGAVVHHINGDPFDNRKENLVICENQGYHMLIHRRQRALKDCGHADWVKCRRCLQYDDLKNLGCRDVKQNRWSHRKCEREYNAECRERQRQRKYGY